MWVAVRLVPPAQQDSLARAKDFYSAAAYEDALDLLKKLNLNEDSTAGRPTEVAVYEMFCLVALGRQDEAKTVIAAIVRADPLYHLPESAAPPRLRALFEDVRRPLLSDVLRQAYARGREAFDRKDLPAAAAAFDRVIALLDDPDVAKLDGSADLRTLASGFRDLSRVSTPPPAAPPAGRAAPVGAPTTTQTARPGTPQVFGPDDVGVTPPVAIIQKMPEWNPTTPGDAAQEFRGALELLIDEGGRVLSVTLIKSVHRQYDAPLLAAAKHWKFMPAKVNGTSVRYRYVMGIQLRRIG